jgi:hypothetical protein
MEGFRQGTMSTPLLFYHVFAKTDSECHLAKQAQNTLKVKVFCPKCFSPKEPPQAIDAFIEEEVPTDPPMNFIWPSALGLITKKFLKQFDAGVISRDLFLGKLYGSKGPLIKDWVTFRARRQLIIRGSQNAVHRRCTQCHCHSYSATGKRYIYPTPPGDEDVFESNLAGLVIRGTLLTTKRLRSLRGVYVEKLAVPREPADGLGVLD